MWSSKPNPALHLILMDTGQNGNCYQTQWICKPWNEPQWSCNIQDLYIWDLCGYILPYSLNCSYSRVEWWVDLAFNSFPKAPTSTLLKMSGLHLKETRPIEKNSTSFATMIGQILARIMPEVCCWLPKVFSWDASCYGDIYPNISE